MKLTKELAIEEIDGFIKTLLKFESASIVQQEPDTKIFSKYSPPSYFRFAIEGFERFKVRLNNKYD